MQTQAQGQGGIVGDGRVQVDKIKHQGLAQLGDLSGGDLNDVRRRHDGRRPDVHHFHLHGGKGFIGIVVQVGAGIPGPPGDIEGVVLGGGAHGPEAAQSLGGVQGAEGGRPVAGVGYVVHLAQDALVVALGDAAGLVGFDLHLDHVAHQVGGDAGSILGDGIDRGRHLVKYRDALVTILEVVKADAAQVGAQSDHASVLNEPQNKGDEARHLGRSGNAGNGRRNQVQDADFDRGPPAHRVDANRKLQGPVFDVGTGVLRAFAVELAGGHGAVHAALLVDFIGGAGHQQIREQSQAQVFGCGRRSRVVGGGDFQRGVVMEHVRLAQLPPVRLGLDGEAQGVDVAVLHGFHFQRFRALAGGDPGGQVLGLLQRRGTELQSQVGGIANLVGRGDRDRIERQQPGVKGRVIDDAQGNLAEQGAHVGVQRSLVRGEADLGDVFRIVLGAAVDFLELNAVESHR